MLISLLLFSAPVLLVIADTLLPSAILSASLSPHHTASFHDDTANPIPTSYSPLETLSFHFRNYDFRYSLIDIPIISIVRSAVIICVYSFCDGPKLSRGPYLGITTVCSLLSLVFVSLKASYVFGVSSVDQEGYINMRVAEIALFLCSLILAVGHIIVAYRTSCRERRKLLVYKIDIEAECARQIPYEASAHGLWIVFQATTGQAIIRLSNKGHINVPSKIISGFFADRVGAPSRWAVPPRDNQISIRVFAPPAPPRLGFFRDRAAPVR
uniref:MENTAL domain-containing protein n=1 Tax=Cannabis sativa TaxID=3483 RepID=A0A803P181_CANSA